MNDYEQGLKIYNERRMQSKYQERIPFDPFVAELAR